MSSRIRYRLGLSAALFAAAVALSACDSAEERAEEHFQSAKALSAEGDTDRALVELRNALQLDETHVEARMLIADISLERGQMRSGYGHLLAVAELDPENMPVRRRLAQLAILRQNWDEAERHGSALLASAEGETDESRIIDLALRFREAAVARDEPAIREILAEGEALYAENDESEILQRILIEGLSRNQEYDRAGEIMDSALAQRPDDRLMWDMKLALLGQEGDVEAIDEHLRAMIDRFPGDAEIQSNLIRFLASTGRADEAEEFMRGLIDETEDGLAAQISVIAFLQQRDGPEAALAETERAIAARPEDSDELTALRAGLLFDLGQRQEGIAILEGLTETDAEDGAAQVNGWKIALARMLQAEGNEVGARTLVEEVLASDPSMIEAIKMQAAWQIEGDRVDEAIAALRRALDQAPDDPQILTLLSQAHARAGDAELAEEMLALSVEASNYAIQPSLNYARRLLSAESYRAAEDVLVNALRRNGNDLTLFLALSEVYLGEEDFGRAEGVERALRELQTETASTAADELRVRILGRREGLDAAVGFLETLVDESGNDVAARIALIRARLAAGDNEQALDLAETFREDDGGIDGILVAAAAQLAAGEIEAAEASFTEAVEADPENVRAWVQLVRVQNALGRSEDAEATLERGLQAVPDAPDLLWAKASVAEARNDIDEAISIYSTLYERLPNSVVVANNLGSLLATYRDDEESLERAYTVTRRLRGTEIAPFADTYGWILFRRGDAEEALEYLETAAAGLPNDPIVQYHHGRVLEELGRSEEARAAFARALDVAPENDPREQIADARERLEGGTSVE